jgi:hypothetical protein
MKQTPRAICKSVSIPMVLAIALMSGSCSNGPGATGPSSDAVQQCVTDIWQKLGYCPQYFTLDSIRTLDSRKSADEAHVIAELSVRVHLQMGQDSMAATNCTGTAWALPPKRQRTTIEMLMQVRDPLDVGQQLIIRKEFTFQKWQSGWRCADTTLSPVQSASALAWTSVSPAQAPAPTGASKLAVGQGGLQQGTYVDTRASCDLIVSATSMMFDGKYFMAAHMPSVIPTPSSQPKVFHAHVAIAPPYDATITVISPTEYSWSSPWGETHYRLCHK